MNKGEEARKAVLAAAAGKTSSKPKVEVWHLDLANYSSVLTFGERIKSLPRLDALLANAGIDTTHFERVEGHESILTVNVISTFLSAVLAVPKLRETSEIHRKPSHLTVTGSVIHIFAKDNYLSEPGPGHIFKSLDDETTADMNDRYHLSKLMVLLAARQLAEQLRHGSEKGGSSVIVNCVNPGWCRTELFRTHDGGFGGRLGLRLIGRSAEEGSRTLVYGAVADEDSHGKYLSECRVKSESTWVRSDEAARTEKRLWTELVDILEGIRPGITKLC